MRIINVSEWRDVHNLVERNKTSTNDVKCLLIFGKIFLIFILK